MPKINQEEYEILKELKKDGYKLIARMKEGKLIKFEAYHGKSEQRWMITTNYQGTKYGSIYNPKSLFQFIQWEDSEPYNIPKLIEEYEEQKEPSFTIQDRLTPMLESLFDGSEETEVKKNIEWLKKEVGKLEDLIKDALQASINTKNNHFAHKNDSELQVVRRISDLINQLDEPETLSQDWIEEHEYIRMDPDNPFVYVKDLQNLLVPKQEVTEQQVLSWLDNNQFYDHATAETVLEKAVDDGELSYYGTKYSVVEKPTIPQLVADWIEESKEQIKDVYIFFTIKNFKHEEAQRWAMAHSNLFTRAYLNGYVVEKKQEYYARIKGHENIGGYDKYWNYEISTEEVSIGGNKVHEDVLTEYVLKATKNEWANLGINDNNADFEKLDN